MKMFLVFLCVMTLVFGLGGITGAATITITDTTLFYADHTEPNLDLVSYGGTYVDKLEYMLDWVEWNHHFDFVPPAQEILSGTLTLSLVDDEGDVFWNPHTWDIGIGWAEDGTWYFGGVDTGDYSYDPVVSYLADGSFTVFLASLWGDFYIYQSELEITYNPVPIPSTLVLLASGLLALIGLRRRLR